ncbi:MAG TPA: HepT-like ribonuclease domain-containing protein [Acetobacteraceae bacterium]|nr:HepT-like ribonuclease domain-containing protein [Acetobacteraceae bacterium]
MKPDDRIRLMHMAESLGHAIRFVEGHSRADLDSNRMLTFALLYALQTVGEAANNVSQEARNQLPQIPWAVIIGMRHRLVHAYADVDHDILWTTATEAAPKLLGQVNRALGLD